MSIINENLIRFIRHEIADEKITIGETTQIEADLGISGIDADKFILSFSEKFHVDITEFNIDNYFEPEVDLFSYKRKKRVQLTVGDLGNAIRERKLT